MAAWQFFLFPHSLTLKKFWSPFDPLKGNWSPFRPPKNPAPTNRCPPLGKNNYTSPMYIEFLWWFLKNCDIMVSMKMCQVLGICTIIVKLGLLIFMILIHNDYYLWQNLFNIFQVFHLPQLIHKIKGKKLCRGISGNSVTFSERTKST